MATGGKSDMGETGTGGTESGGRESGGRAALLIVDMINDMDFAGGDGLRRHAERAVPAILRLRDAAEKARVPVIYVNDNYGQWHSERSRLVDHCLRHGSDGRDIVRRIAPREDDYFVIKPHFSGFYATNLPALLGTLGATRLILTGIAADICILFTGADAHMRGHALWVPEDAVAAASPERKRWALEIMADAMSAETKATGELALEDWLRGG